MVGLLRRRAALNSTGTDGQTDVATRTDRQQHSAMNMGQQVAPKRSILTPNNTASDPRRQKHKSQ